MATINVNATVSAPSEINIPLVRADLHATSNTFRLFFEAFLTCFSTTLGAILTMPGEVPTIYWTVLGVFAGFGVAAGIYTWRYNKLSRRSW